MASDLNQCSFIGRLGKDPELRETKSGEPMTIFSIAVNESYTSRQGGKVKNTEWINIVAYRKLAEISGKYLTKGALVYVSGKLNSYTYQKEGQEKFGYRIVMNELHMLGSKFHQEDKNETPEVCAHDDSLVDDVPF
jgi:single-strand DNA-binding protein